MDQIGRLDGLAIGQGDVLIEGLGLNAENVRYVDIVTRLAKIQGELVAGEELNIHTGNGRFDYKTRAISSDPNAAATGATFAVDASALGGMYAGRIKIISSEAGLGVRNDAKLVANVDDLVITAQGDIAYADARAKRDMKVQAKGNITQTRLAQAGNDLRLTAGKAVDLSGDALNATAALDIQGDAIKLHGASKATPLKVAARTANLGGKQGVQLARVQLQADETATLQSDQGHIAFSQGSASANQLTITAARNITNEDYLLHAGQALTLRAIAGNIENRNAGSLWSKGTLSADAGNTVDNKGLIRSTDDMKIVAGGALNNTGDAKQSGLMVTDAALTLEAGGAFTNQSGAISAQSAVVKAQSITFHHAGQTTQGGLIVGGDMTLTAKGALRNTGQIIKTDGNLSATAQSLANSNDGNTVGEMRATETMDLDVTSDLANQGLIYATDSLDMTVGGAVTNTGDANKTGIIVTKAALALQAEGAFTNQGGVVAAQSAVVDAQAITLNHAGQTNRGGLVVDGKLTLAAKGALSNTGQIITAGGNLSATAQSLANTNDSNTIGEMRATGAMTLKVTDVLANKGLLYAADTLDMTVGGAMTNTGDAKRTGLIVTNAALNLQAGGILTNQGGAVAAKSAVIKAGEITLNQSGQTTRGGLLIGGNMTLTATKALRNTGQIIKTDGNLSVTVQSLANNDDGNTIGEMRSTGTMTLSVTDGLANQGLLYATGTLDITVGGEVTNTGDAKRSGLMVTNAALNLQAGGILTNQGGAVAAKSAVIKAREITLNHAGQTTQGGFLVGGNITLTATGALRNTGQIIKAGNLSATAQSLTNSNDGNTVGEMRSTGTMDLDVTSGLANQGLLYAAGALDMTVGGAVTNTGDAKKTGLVLSKAALTLNANGALTNQGGAISAQSAAIKARSIQLRAIPGNTDVGGLLFGGDATLTTVDDLDNQGQQINAQGALTITARSLSNRNNGQMVGKLRSGQAMDLHISQGLTNEGYLYASNTLTAKAGGALINRGNGNDTGILLSDGALTIDADGALESRGGMISAQSAVLNARSVLLDRTGQTTDRGGLSTKADASLVVTTGFTNNGQRVSAGRDLTIDAAAIVNQSGAGQVGKLHATGKLSLTSGAGLTNRGRIEGVGVNLKTRSTVTNIGDGKTSGVIVSGNALTLDITGNLDNRGILSSKENSTITLSGGLLNAARRISIGGDLRIKAATLDNSGGGEIEIGGNLTTVGQLASVDNRSGRIKGLTAGKTLALNMRALRNEGGNIASNGSVSLVIDADYDLKGAFSAGGTLAVQAKRLRNYTRLDAGEMLRLTASGNFSNETGAVLASNRDIQVTASGAIVNKSEITSGRNLKLEAKGGNLTNEAGAKITGGEGNTTLIASSSVINRNKLSSKQDMAITAAGLDNYGQVATGRDLAATVSGNLYNRENKLLFAGRSMTLNVSGALDNNRAKLYSQGNMTLRGLSGGNSASIRNFVGTIEAGGNLTIRTNKLDNLAEVYDSDSSGKYGYNITRVNKGGRGWNSYSVMEQDEVTSTLRARPSYISAGSNLAIYNAAIHNYSSVISAHGNLTVSGGSLKNETASENTVDLKRKWGKEWDEPYEDCWKIGPFKIRCKTKHRRKSHEYWDTYTTTVYAQEQAIFNANGTINVNGQSIRNGSVKSLDNPSHTTTYNTASIERIKKTGQIDLTEFLTLPQGEHGFFRLNPPEGNVDQPVLQGKEIQEIAVSATNPKRPQLERAVATPRLTSPTLPLETKTQYSPTKPHRTHRYLIESNVEFIDTTRFVGSEYFLDRMGVDLDESLRLMGDAVVETRLVERAILEVTNHAFLSGDIGSSAEQMTRLYDAALAEAERFEQEGMPLTVGVALSPEQVKSLRHDMIWLEEREVAGARVLAPQLYLSQATLAQIETGTGPVISGGDVLLTSQEDFGNQGAITARRDVGISSEGSFTNTGSVDAGKSLVMDVKEDIVNRGPGSLYGGDLVALYAEGDIRNESAAEEIHLGEDIVSRMKDIASIKSGGNLILDAGGDIVQKAAKLNAKGSAVLEAGGNISFETIALRNKSDNRVSSDNYSIHDRTEHIGSEAVFGGDLVMTSGGDTTLTATRMEVGGGADITTGGNFNLLSAQNTYHSESHYEYDDGGWFGGSGSEDSVSDRTQQVSSVLKTGDKLSVDSRDNITLLASTIEAGGAAALKAKNNINVLNAYDTAYQRTQSSKSGFISSKQTDKGRIDDTVVASVIKSGDDISFEAEGNVAIIGSELDVEKNLSFGTFTVGRDKAGNLLTDEYGHYVTKDGSAVGGLLIAAAEERHEDWSVEKSGIAIFGITLDKRRDEVRNQSVDQIASLLDVEGNLRANTKGDINIIGSEVEVAGSGAIHADGDVNVLSAQESRHHYESHMHMGMNGLTGGWDGSRLSVGLKGEYTEDTLTETTVTQKKSKLSFGGGLLLNTESSLLVSASDIETGGSMTIQADDGLAVVSAEDVRTTEEERTKGEAKVTVGIGNAYNDTYQAVKAAKEAAENVKRAKEALDAFDGEIAQMREDLKQGLVTEEDIRERKADRKYFVANLAAATANAANAAIQVGAAGAKAAAAASTSYGTGFYADLKMEVDVTKSTSRSEQRTAVGSSLIAGGDMNLSSGADLHIQGSDIMASGVMDLIAAENVLIESAQDTYREDFSSEQRHWEKSMTTAGISTDINSTGGISSSNKASGSFHLNFRI
uniref:Adhesin HecA family 20-residue repeat-containing protein n=1 Tax=Candidatus Kentrum sp. LPFa TaxID=2126335 RepID=A0A450WEY2_9GAMM|nr:MAG: adhesin HecA family 20-residue repeat-containing protein [Candidatus Kentron sp. LPFa]